MNQFRNNENIYGYSGKKAPQHNFVSSNRNSTEIKPKPQVILKPAATKELLIKTLCFQSEIEDITSLEYRDADKIFKLELGDIQKTPQDLLNKDIQVSPGLFAQLSQHEKGVSVKINSFEIFPSIEINGDAQTITFTKQDNSLKVTESKIGFKNATFPLHYVFENSDQNDGIFNDFVQSNIPEIRPPTTLTVPSKRTQSVISFRQQIGYIKTRSFLNFTVGVQGWTVKNFADTEDEPNLPSGVNVLPVAYWTYHPRCTRIEHLLLFS